MTYDSMTQLGEVMTYDIETLKAIIDCREFAGQFTSLKAKDRQGKELTGSCPVCKGKDRFNVQRARWLCRTCTDGKWRDIIHLGALVWKLDSKTDFIEICRRLEAPESAGPRPVVVPEPDDDGPPLDDWQKVVKGLARYFEDVLWSQDGEQARAWLNKRGLFDSTIRLFGIGYNPVNQKLAGHWVYNGITIPHLQPGTGTLWAVKIRLGTEGRATWLKFWQQNNPDKDPAGAGIPKYMSIAGSRQNLFNADSLLNKQSAFVCEGEFDTMLLQQQTAPLVGAITLGSCTNHLGQRWLPVLLPISRFYLAMDNDRPGHNGRKYWQELLGKRGVVAEVPAGKDITEYHQAGGDLWQWVRGYELERGF